MSEQKRITRRRFLALAGGTIGVTALTCGGLAVLGTRQPAVELIESNCGDGNEVKDRILVAYATRCGSTGEIAEAIGQALCEGGAAVDVRPVKDVTDVNGYQAVVVGSAIRIGQWLPEAVKFVETHQDALRRVPVAYFAACMTLAEDTEENRRTTAAYLDPVREIVQPVAEGLFAGAMDFSKLPFALRLMVKAMKSEEGDLRDWDSIDAWATNMHPVLSGA